MKKLLLFLCLLFAFAVPATATDVTISALTVSGFSPSAIGNDRLIAVSASNGSPTVTSSGLFTGIVGMGGFQVLIDGTQYAVASVESTSSLTLTANYSGTPGAQTMTLYKYVIMRVYADRAFQPLGDTQIVQPGTVGSGAFFRQVAASVVNNGSTDQLFLPEIVIPATTDALITNQARYSFPLYRPGGSQITFFFCPSSISQFVLPPATPTTWGAVCQFNAPSAIIPPNREAYSKAEIDARLPSCSQNNGVYYSASGNILNCLIFGNGLTLTSGTLEASAGGSGYNRIQEEGANVTQRAIFNFVGTAATAADDAGNTRTNITFDPDLNALASIGGTGFAARTAADTWALRTHTGTAAEITVTNGNGASGNPTYSLPSALTFSGKTITGGTFATPTITTPTITGGTHTAITGLGIRSTGSGAFDLTLANTENLTAGRTLTFTLNNAARTLNMAGNITTGGAFSTTGTFSTGGNFLTGNTFSTTGTFSTGGNFSTANTFSTTGTFASGGNFSTGSTFSTTGTFATGGNFSTGNTFSTTGTFSSGGNFSTGAAFTTTPANALTLTTTGSTNVTLPTTGTLAAINATDGRIPYRSASGALSDSPLFREDANTVSQRNSTTTQVSRFYHSFTDASNNQGAEIRHTSTGTELRAITAGTGADNLDVTVSAAGTGRVVIKGYPYTLEVNTTVVGNVGTGTDTLHSYPLAADSLDNNGDFLEISYGGRFATNDNDKRIQISIDGQLLFNSGAFDFDGAGGNNQWSVKLTIVRVSATSVVASLNIMLGQVLADGAASVTGSNGIMSGQNVTVTVANLDSNAVTIAVAAEATSNNDVTQSMSTIKLVQR